MARKRLNDTSAIASKPVVETTNPDYSGFRSVQALPGLPGHQPAAGSPMSPDSARGLRGAVCYLNGGLSPDDCGPKGR